MNAEVPWYERAFDAPYLEVYGHRDAAEAETATTHLLAPLSLEGRRVLDLACGAGRYSAAVARRGAAVVGLDLSPALLAAAQRDAPDLLGLVRGHMLRLPFAPGCFDLVLCMFTSFGYMESAAADRSVLGEIQRVLRPQGQLVLDLFNATSLRRNLVAETTRRAGPYEVRERRRLDAAGVVVKEIELRAGGRVHRYRESVRLWPRESLLAALRAAGLEPRQLWGGYDATAYESTTSPRLVVLADAVGGPR